MAKVTEPKKVAESNSSDEGLILYHTPPSYYSQKIYFALQEKKLKFRSHYVNLIEAEHLQPWFLKLNPKSQVPVLKDGVKIIPESESIMDYLEDNFSNGDTPRLKPDKGTPQYQTMERFRQMFEKVQMPIITFGCVFHPELTQNMKMSTMEKTMRKKFHSTALSKIEEYMEKNKDFKNIYSAKKEAYTKFQKDTADVDNVKKAIKELGSVLDNVEKELASHEGDKESWWLCGEKFTVVDITLGIILNRVSKLGLWNQFFGDAKLPKLNNYFRRIQTRDAYKKTMHQTSGIMGKICCLGTKEKLAVSLSTAVIVVGIAGLALFIAQRNK